MRLSLLLLAIILVGGFLFVWNRQHSKAKTLASSSPLTPGEAQERERMYGELRRMALNMTPDQLGLSLSEQAPKVFGLIMDWDVGEGIATVVAYQTGDASMYMSNGGGIIGGGTHPRVARVAKEFVELSKTFLAQARPTTDTPLPERNSIRFYLLTNKGRYMAQETMTKIEDETSPWFPLFIKANEVITEVRQSNPKR